MKWSRWGLFPGQTKPSIPNWLIKIIALRTDSELIVFFPAVKYVIVTNMSDINMQKKNYISFWFFDTSTPSSNFLKSAVLRFLCIMLISVAYRFSAVSTAVDGGSCPRLNLSVKSRWPCFYSWVESALNWQKFDHKNEAIPSNSCAVTAWTFL